MQQILIATPDEVALQTIENCFQSGQVILAARNRETCISSIKTQTCEMLFMDLSFLVPPGMNKKDLDYSGIMQEFLSLSPMVNIFILCTKEEIRTAVNFVKAGAADYLTFPVTRDEVQVVYDKVCRLMKTRAELEYLRDKFWKIDSWSLLHTRSPIMQNTLNKIKAVAPTRTTILLTGETGTGKSILAKLIHNHSSRSNQLFVPVHCGTIPDTLIESELFGHERGAFTGATRKKLGKFEIANGGTIFLDEIGTITPSLQIKLLQVLQEKHFQRVGGEKQILADVRIIAASNLDLQTQVKKNLFREDLFYRLNVFPIHVPPLRERMEDIPLLVRAILDKFNKIHLKKIQNVHPDVTDAFTNYNWPGNIRELENVIERAFIIEQSAVLEPKSFPDDLFAKQPHSLPDTINVKLPLEIIRKNTIEKIEQEYLKMQLTECDGNMTKAAAATGISTRQLLKLLTKYGINKNHFKPRYKNQNP